ncbi:unnamed protein product [Polarella glacialis]|uniref:Pseudouridine synthase RsuA/RluA-like domain-containing protein n=1 Tax=Polarella glacialis TaxID=89957 RepID=A0A813G5I8_POLGL|nr:unnamed protein product [Polarella glacialis]
MPVGKHASTEISASAYLQDDCREKYSLLEINLHTGRKHQIRAHLAHQGHPLVSDKKYGGQARRWCPRIFLHSHHLAIKDSHQPIDLHCALPGDLREALACLRPCDKQSQSFLEKWVQ